MRHAAGRLEAFGLYSKARRAMSTSILPVPSPPTFGITFCARPGEPERVDVAVATDEGRKSLDEAAAHLRRGELVAFPTETVYGLGACALRAESAAKIYQAKNRPMDNPLIVHVSDRAMLRRLVPASYEVNGVCSVLMDTFWPGPLTLLFPVGAESGTPLVPRTVTCGQQTVGVRMPSHPIARALIALADVPIAAPSANASGRPSPTSAAHVYHDLAPKGVLKYIVDGGACSVGVESTVVDAVTVPGEVRVLRPGGVSVEALQDALAAHGLLAGAPNATSDAAELRVYGKTLERTKAAEETPTTPGMKYRHYSPEARVLLVQHAATSDVSLRALLEKQCAALQEAAAGAHDATAARRHAGATRIGVMCAVDSPLMAVVAELAPLLSSWAHERRAEAGSSRLSPVVAVGAQRVCVYSLGLLATPAMAAQRLFDGLRTLDAEVVWDGAAGPCDLILVEEIPETGMGLAVMNRLQKAATETVAIGRI